jgi:hypothetical protein
VTSTEGAKSLDHPLMSKTDKNVYLVKVHVLKNKIITICDVTNMLRISFESYHRILKDKLYTCQISDKFTPHLLSEQQKIRTTSPQARTFKTGQNDT